MNDSPAPSAPLSADQRTRTTASAEADAAAPVPPGPSLGPAEIEARIPHRPPMRLLDEVVQWNENSLHARKTFSEDEFFVQGHFPDYPLVPGVIQCECCLQAGAILLRHHTPEGGDFVPVATRMDSVKFKNMVRPGDTVDIHVTLKERLANAFFLSGKMLLNGKITTRLEFACSITSPSITSPSITSPSITSPSDASPREASPRDAGGSASS